MSGSGELTSYASISKLVSEGVIDFTAYGRVRSVVYGDLIKLYYMKSAFFEGGWNWFELHSRGHVYQRATGKLVALPFDKFFNLGEKVPHPDVCLVDAVEKIDGTLGIGYKTDKWRISTRGSFESEQSVWATDFLHQEYPQISRLPSFLTPLFEIVYPKNYYVSDLVVDYGDIEELYLIGLRNCLTHDDYFFSEVKRLAEEFGFGLPCVHQFEDVDEVLASKKILSDNEEGWVLRFSDGSRYKVKGDEYLERHRLVSSFSPRRIFERFSEHMTNVACEGCVPFGSFICEHEISSIPNDLYPVHPKHVDACQSMVRQFSADFLKLATDWFLRYMDVADIKDRGDFAREVMARYKDNAHLMFALRDKDLVKYVSLILNRVEQSIDIDNIL